MRTKAGIIYCIVGFQSVAQHAVSDIHTHTKIFPIFDCAGAATLINKYSFRVDEMRNTVYNAGHFISFQTVSNSCHGRFSMKTADSRVPYLRTLQANFNVGRAS